MTLECITVSADPIGYVIRGLNTARSLFLAISLVASQQLNIFLLPHPPSPSLAPVKNTDIIIDNYSYLYVPHLSTLHPLRVYTSIFMCMSSLSTQLQSVVWVPSPGQNEGRLRPHRVSPRSSACQSLIHRPWEEPWPRLYSLRGGAGILPCPLYTPSRLVWVVPNTIPPKMLISCPGIIAD